MSALADIRARIESGSMNRYSMTGGYASSGGMPSWEYRILDSMTGTTTPCKSSTSAGAHLELNKLNAEYRAQQNRSGQLARCGCGKQAPSSPDLAFFEFCGEGSKEAVEICTCGYHKVAHRPDFKQACQQFTAKGPQEFDRYFCGCRGWD